jgi:hypothetical protein
MLHAVAALDFGSATYSISPKVSFYQCPSTCAALPAERTDVFGNSSERTGVEKFSRRWAPHFLLPAQKVARDEASTEMLRILHESGENHFEEIATGNESWSQYSYPSSKMFARSPADIIPRTRQAIGTKGNMIAIFFTRRKLIVLDILPQGSKFNQLYFVDYIFPDSKRGNVNFHWRVLQATYWMPMDNSLYHNGSKVVSKFEKHHVSRLPHRSYSLDMSPCDL